MAKKTISNSFTVNTVEDGSWPQYIYYLSSRASIPQTPETSQDDYNCPDDWSLVPVSVTQENRYLYISQRVKNDGMWGEYSTPSLFSYRAEDGRSIHISGTAVGIDSYPQNPQVGNVILLMTSTGGNIEKYINPDGSPYWDEQWAGEDAAYMYDGDLYVSVSGGSVNWENVGQIKGDKGDPAVAYEIVFEQASAKVGSDGNLEARFRCHVLKTTGSSQSLDNAGVMKMVTNYNTQGESMCGEDGYVYEDDSAFDGNYSWESYGSPTAIMLKYYVNNIVVATATIPVAVQGKIGRFFYFAGAFNSSDSSQQFIVNDAQAPYFEHTVTETTQSGTTTIKRYHVFNGSNGTYTMAQMWSASSQSWNNKPWEAMTNDFKYIITQALFAAYAHLGSWIFNEDYMLSEKDANGQPRGSQTYNGMTDSQLATGFIPSIAFDALNGRASFGGDKIRFQPNGSGWLANQHITWDANGNANFDGAVKTKNFSVEFADIRNFFDKDRFTTFYVGVDTEIYDRNGQLLQDIEGIWNFTVGGQAIYFPTNAYGFENFGQRVILYNPYSGEAGSMATTVYVVGSSTSDLRYIRGVGQEAVGTLEHPVPQGTVVPINEIVFINGVLELMCVPAIDPVEGQLCDWAVVNIGTNVYSLNRIQ